MIITALVFLIILSILVLVHEFGHFVVGKFFGVGVEEFAMGLPFSKPIFSKKLRSGMKLSLYPLLFGGFVKLLGEENEQNRPNNQIKGKFFYKVGVWPRIFVVVAGVSMNLLLAVAAFYLFLTLSGFKVLVPRLSDYQFSSPNGSVVVITNVETSSPAEKVGLKTGDVISGFASLPKFQKYVIANSGKEISLEVADMNFNNKKTVKVIPRKDPPKGQGALGVGIAEAVVLDYSTDQDKAMSGLSYTKDMFVYNLNVVSQLVVQSRKEKNIAPLSENVSGPFGIAEAVSQILKLGGWEAVVSLVNLLGILSLSLAFMNILPFPALDGGRLAFLLVEAFTGKKIPGKIENLINQGGMILLLLLIVLISFNDVVKIVVK
jgi:regulator of sigma E protease